MGLINFLKQKFSRWKEEKKESAEKKEENPSSAEGEAKESLPETEPAVEEAVQKPEERKPEEPSPVLSAETEERQASPSVEEKEEEPSAPATEDKEEEAEEIATPEAPAEAKTSAEEVKAEAVPAKPEETTAEETSPAEGRLQEETASEPIPAEETEKATAGEEAAGQTEPAEKTEEEKENPSEEAPVKEPSNPSVAEEKESAIPSADEPPAAEEKKTEESPKGEAPTEQGTPEEKAEPVEDSAIETPVTEETAEEQPHDEKAVEQPAFAETAVEETETKEEHPVEQPAPAPSEERIPQAGEQPQPTAPTYETAEKEKTLEPEETKEDKPSVQAETIEAPEEKEEKAEASKPEADTPAKEEEREEKKTASEDRPPEPAPEAPVLVKADKVEAKEETEGEKMDKYIAGLDKSRMGFTDRIKKLAARNKVVNQEYFDQLERILIEADVGVDLSLELIKETASEAAVQKIEDPAALNDLLIDKMFIGYANEGGSFATDLQFAKEGPTVVFMCGVNGGGKTTTTAKLAKKYKDRGKKILLVAADTFRAGAVEQLTYWANKVGVDIVSRPNADPASLCFDALKKAVEERYDLVFVDTAGRLQNKKALMDELSKVVRVMKKVLPDAPHEALLVLDANTGQNGIDQAMVFKDTVPLTGIVITKMDGTSKGGILLAIRHRLSLPVRFIGLGEKMGDLEEFDLDKYLYGLLIGDEED